MPRFSVIIPCFNAQDTLPQTLSSLTTQTFTEWEAICIDDGSTDATCAIVKAASLRDPRIKLVKNPGKGPSQARNYGALEIATGHLIAFCDADDIWSDCKLSDLQETFADTTVGGAFSRTAFFNEHPSDATAFSTIPDGDLSIEMLLGENPVCTMSNMTVLRDVFAATGGFDETMVHNEDLEWLIRLVGTGTRVVGMNALHTWYRASTGGLSSDLNAMKQARKQAVATALRFGVSPSGKSHAIYHRYLSRRSLRLAHGRFEPLHHALNGLLQSPTGFLFPIRRGGLTLAAALCVAVLPKHTSETIFSK